MKAAVHTTMFVVIHLVPQPVFFFQLQLLQQKGMTGRMCVCVHKGNEAAPAGIEKEPYLSVNAIKHSDKLLLFYTGLENYDVFLHAYLSGRQC